MLAITNIINKNKIEETADYRRQIFFHLEYHPRGITRAEIRKVFEETIGKLMPNRKLTITISRPKNLRDRLSPADLMLIPQQNPSNR